MTIKTNEEKKLIEEKLKNIGLNLENIPKIFENPYMIKYRTKKGYSDINYKVYRYVDINDIEILLTPTTRLDDISKKYKLSKPLIAYLEPDNEENIENYLEFLNMLKELNTDRISDIEEEQKRFEDNLPYEIKYKDNFMWDIYYSEVEDKYFMLFPTKETQVETLFYLIKEKIKLQKSKKTKKIYIPINQEDYSYDILKKSEISDLENYLWFFTKTWPVVYEVTDKDNNKTIQIIGKTEVYEGIKSIYKYVFNNKEEAQEKFKLIKALFILQSNLEQYYKFNTIINENGELDFCFNRVKITYRILPIFINTEMQKNKEKIRELQDKNILEKEKLLLLEKSLEKQKEEYTKKEKQIVVYLECKKTFFGRVSYYFKSKKRKNEKLNIEESNSDNNEKIEIKNIQIEEKENYTIEDLLKLTNILQEEEKTLKNNQMDIKALENKKENLERKIKNATLYINEIENHKKSIFEFWKFTNKDEVSLLQEGETLKENTDKNNKIEREFLYEEDIERLSEKIDEKQRKILSEKEIESIFSIKQDIESFNILSKEKLLKKDEKQIEKILKQIKEQYEKDFDNIKEKDFDIFGSVVEDKTKIKVLNNKKHREIKKDKYKILNIHLDTTLEQYIDIIKHYLILLNEAYFKIVSPYNMPIYQISNEELKENKFEIFDLNSKKVLSDIDIKQDNIILNKINIKENMPILFYTNIMYYNNTNNTLPLGMDISTEVLVDLKQYDLTLISRKDFKINILENEYKNNIKTIQVYEYDIKRKEK